MPTVLVTNLAPIKDPEARFFLALFESFERRGARCVFWSASYHPKLSPWYLPMHWTIENWPGYFAALPAAGAECEREKWRPRVAALVKQNNLTPDALLDTITRATRAVLDAVQPDLLLSWNTLCPHTGIAADVCRARGIPVQLLERGMFPQTWYCEPGGLLGHSEIAGVSLESLVPEARREELRAIGSGYVHGTSFQAFNSYPQAPLDLPKLDEICARFPRRIAFFPPDDGTLGFVPYAHPDRERTIPGYTDSFAAARAVAAATDAAVIFKPHPSFLGKKYDTSGLPNLFVVGTDFRIVIDRCQVVASTGSGLAFVALAQGKPHLELVRDWLQGKGISYEALTPAELPGVIAAALSGERLAERLARFETFVGWLFTDYLISHPDADPRHKKADRAAAAMLARVAAPMDAAKSLDWPAARSALLTPKLGEFIAGQAAMHGPGSGDPPARTRTNVADVAAVLAATPADRIVILDWDHTLFLGNSTELFLAKSGPRWLSYLVALAADELHRLCSSAAGYAQRRDQIRVAAVACLLPWTLLVWRWQAAALMRERLNTALWAAVRGRRVQIASLGFRVLIDPLARALDAPASITASNLLPPWRSIRSRGKLAALERDLGAAAVADAVGITDSRDDAPMLRAVAEPLLLQWPEPPKPVPAYVPLRYTAEGKYPGKRILINQQFGEDLAVWLLAVAWGGWETLLLVPLFLALFAIYEIGYYENDFVAAKKEKSPVVSPQAKAFAEYRIGWAWAWAIALSAVAIPFLPGDWLWNSAIWAGVLLATRVSFAWYNRLATSGRTWVYPVLQVLKSFGCASLFTITPAGGLLLGGQVMRQVTNYAVYRSGGDTKLFRRQTHRLVVFGMLVIAAIAIRRDVQFLLEWQSAAIVGWLCFRVAREKFGPIPLMARRTLGWLRSRFAATPAAATGAAPIVIFGAGTGGEQAATALQPKRKIIGFSDNDASKHGKTMRGLPILSPADVAARGEAEICIATYYHYVEIYSQLRRLGVPDARIGFYHLKTP